MILKKSRCKESLIFVLTGLFSVYLHTLTSHPPLPPSSPPSTFSTTLRMKFNSLVDLVSFIPLIYLLSEQLNWVPIMESVEVVAWGLFKLSVWISCYIWNTTWLLFALCFSCLKKSWCHSCFGHGG